MEDKQLVILSKAFAVDIINLCEKLRERKKASAIINQLLRSGTSIGANIHEAKSDVRRTRNEIYDERMV